MINLLLIITNYLIGSISPAILIASYKQVDIRSIGHKTAGGSNVAQNIGKKWGIVVGVIDFFKPIPLLFFVTINQIIFPIDQAWLNWIALAAMIGQIWPIWHGFSGGRGIGSMLGIMIFLYPHIGFIAFTLFLSGLPLSMLAKKNKLRIFDLLFNSGIVTLYAITTFLLISLATSNHHAINFGVMILIVVLIRRLTARFGEYRSGNFLKLFATRFLYDRSSLPSTI